MIECIELAAEVTLAIVYGWVTLSLLRSIQLTSPTSVSRKKHRRF